jgi:hypothetical protein
MEVHVGRKIEIKVGEQTAVAELMEDKAPKTCAALWDLLPFRGTLIHAKMAGGEFFFKVPAFLELENPTKKQEAGNIAYWNVGQSICVFYESLPGVGHVNTFARITENLTGIQEEGRKGWKKQGAPIEFRKKEGK